MDFVNKSSHIGGKRIKYLLAGMPERRMAHIMPETNGFGKIEIQGESSLIETFAYCSRY
jgi:hypothetical protein